MSRPVQELRERANRIVALLDEGFPLSLAPEEKKTILSEAGKVLHKLDSVERNFLSIGLLGGTGVGKSTLMNALAGARIASASHHRPHTDHVLIYRHNRSGDLSFLRQSTVPSKEITHEVDSIEKILLCDLPDFDSIAAEHRERVIRFLDHLDLLVWVASLEKYGDAGFYEFLAAVHHAKGNFVFVLNKVDLLFRESELQTGYDLLDRTVSQFRAHLRQSGLEAPLLYALAAEQAMEPQGPARWNQFPLFSQYVFQRREVKEIGTIRSANLDVEIQGLFSVLEREVVHSRTLERILNESLQELEERKSAWMGDGREVLTGWLMRQWRAALLKRTNPSALVGPGEAIAVLAGEIGRMGMKEKGPGPESSAPVPPEGVASVFRSQLEEAVDRIRRKMLTHSLPAMLLERTESFLNVTGRTEIFEGELTSAMAVHGQSPPRPPLRWFRFMQHSSYFFLFILFLLAIGGREAWEGILSNPGWGSAFRLAASWISTLFSSQGLAALCSYLLLNLILGFRFYRRNRKKLEKAAEKGKKRTAEVFLAIWEKHILSLEDDLKGFRDDILEKISMIDGSK